MIIDIKKKLQDKANEIFREAIEETKIEIPLEIEEFLKSLTVLSMIQGFKWATQSHKEVSECLLKDLK